ncbi:MAG: hypothetical protein V1820_05000 [archaeon]
MSLERATKGAKMSELGNKIRTKLPRVILNLAVMFSIWFVATLISPAVQSLGAVIPGSQVSTGFLVIVSMVVVILYFAIAVIQDVVAIAETAAETFVHLTPMIKETEANSVKKAIKEIVIAILLVLLTPFIPGTLALIPVIGPTIATVVLFVLIGAALSLFWASGRIFYKELSRYTNHIADIVAGETEKLEGRRPVAGKAKKAKKKR